MTIEVELGAEELRALTQAGGQLPPRLLAQGSACDTDAGGSLHWRTRLALLLCVSSAAVFMAIGSARVAQQRAPAAVPVAVNAGGTIERQAPPPALAAPPVRFRNPFDRREVFEFPAGTSRAEARSAVAKLLRERARERLALLAEKRARRHRPAPPASAQNS